jgi:hypothetical protein
LSIIGVSDEPEAKVAPFIDQKGIKYAIALGGASGYTTSGIPHAWLVSPKGEILWEGHPGNLKDTEIEENLKGVSLTPTFTLPKELKSAEKQINSGNFAEGIKSLETHLKKPKNAETEAAAKEAVEKVKAYGAEQLKMAEEYAKERDYGDAAEILKVLEKSFKGTETGVKAKETLAAWKKDKAAKLELDGYAVVQKAEAAIQAKQYKAAAGLLLQVSKPKKYEGTKIQEVAGKRYNAIKSKI